MLFPWANRKFTPGLRAEFRPDLAGIARSKRHFRIGFEMELGPGFALLRSQRLVRGESS